MKRRPKPLEALASLRSCTSLPPHIHLPRYIISINLNLPIPPFQIRRENAANPIGVQLLQFLHHGLYLTDVVIDLID